MKKVAIFSLVGAFSLGLAACGQDAGAPAEPEAAAEPEAPAEPAAVEPPVAAEGDDAAAAAPEAAAEGTETTAEIDPNTDARGPRP